MTVVLALPGNEAIAAKFAAYVGGELAQAESRSFPDGESYIRLMNAVAGQPVNRRGNA
jgi:ribose-phosphate pyrophosphokinase